MESNAAKILERYIFNEGYDEEFEKIKRRMKNNQRRYNRSVDKDAKRHRLATAAGVGAGLVTAAGLLAWNRHKEKQAEKAEKEAAEKRAAEKAKKG